MIRVWSTILLVTTMAWTSGCGAPPQGPPPVSQAAAAAESAPQFEPAPRSKEKGCVAVGARPDPQCTPGAVMTRDVTLICTQSTKARRHVTTSVHRQAFIEYGVVYTQPEGAYEVDHLIPLALGGDNTIANLWAEPAEPQPGFHQKDAVEDYLRDQVCAGAMNLADAQRAIATDWVAIFRQIQPSILAPREDRDGD